MHTLETARLRLRPIAMDDLDRAHEQFDVHPDVWRFDPGYPPTREQRKRWLQFRIQELHLYGFGCLAIELRATAELIGCCGLEFCLRSNGTYKTPEIELYYRLGRDYWGHGYATEAAREVVRHAFEDLQLEQVIANASSENAASLAVMRGLGMIIKPNPSKPGEVVGVVTNDSWIGATKQERSP